MSNLRQLSRTGVTSSWMLSFLSYSHRDAQGPTGRGLLHHGSEPGDPFFHLAASFEAMEMLSM